MLFSKSNTYELLAADERSEIDTTQHHLSKRLERGTRALFTASGALLLSLSLNVLVSICILRPQSMPLLRSSSVDARSRYASLQRNVPVPIERSTPYSSHNLTEVHSLWEDISIDDGMVALPDSFVQEKGLPEAQRFPWDDDKGLYFLNGYHNLHCLRSVHISLMEFHFNEPQSRRFEHVLHCMDSLRQDIHCNADDTPRYTTITKDPESGVGQTRMCRDWSQLQRWARGFNACYKFVNQTATGFPQVLRFTYCPEGSPYIDKIRKVFDEAGDKVKDHGANLLARDHVFVV